MEACGRGFWTVDEAAKKCDICHDNCGDCSGDKYNCTLCDYSKENNVLFTQMLKIRNDEVPRGTCYQSCPNGFFVDFADPKDLRCGTCASPCSTCEKAADKCLSCDGSGNRRYVYNYQCYEECPDRTAPDLTTLSCVNCGPRCTKCGAQEGPSCYECEKPFLLEEGSCKEKCEVPGNRPNSDLTQCVGKTKFPTFGPLFTVISIIIVIVVTIVRVFKPETKWQSSIVAFVGLVEPLAIFVNLIVTIYDEEWKYTGFVVLALVVLLLLNAYNWHYIRQHVINEEAVKITKVPQQKIKDMMREFDKKNLRREKKKNNSKYGRQTAGGRPLSSQLNVRSGGNEAGGDDMEGGQIEMQIFSDDSASQRQHYSSDEDDFYEGGGNGIEALRQQLGWNLQKRAGVREQFEEAHNLQYDEKSGQYIKKTNIFDRGFKKWTEANDANRVFPTIKWAGILNNFKFWRLSWSYFMGNKSFVILFSKKKFKKKTVVLTFVSMFFVELPLIISGLVSLTELPFGEQLMYSQIDSLITALLLLVFQFWELCIFDKIIKSLNSAAHNTRKSQAALEDSEGSIIDSQQDSDEDDDYDDWRLMLKQVEGNKDLFKETRTQLKINDLEKEFDLRHCDSCPEFNTGWDKEEDDRLVESFPCTPEKYREFDGFDPRDYQQTFDNVYAEKAKQKPTYSEMGMQTHPSEIMGALHRKGGDLLQPGIDKDDFSKRKQSKKKRGRKNKYIAAIDAEDDEEADQMSDEEDGLDGIQEEDDEDEEERNAKLEKLREIEEQAKQKAAAESWEAMLRKKLEIAELIAQARNGNKSAIKALEDKEKQLRAQVAKGDVDAQELLELIEEDKELRWKAKYGDQDAIRRMGEFDELQDLRRKAIRGDPDAIAQLKRTEEELKKKAKKDKTAQKQLDEIQRKIAEQNQNGDKASKD